MRVINTLELENVFYRLMTKAGFSITKSAVCAMENALKTEELPLPRFALETVLKNAEIAKKENLPVCQDTGLAVFFLEIGQEVFLEGELLQAVADRAVKRAYEDNFFRKSSCDPLTRINRTDNTPAFLHTEITASDRIKITFLPKGFGSENMSRVYMLTPSKGIGGIIDAVVETVRLAGSNPCPPVYVGVGIGGTFDMCALLSKKALLREVGSYSPRADLKEIELECLRRINELEIGAQGFKGKTTAIGVSAEAMPTHIAGLPVAVNIQCHCVRCQSEVI